MRILLVWLIQVVQEGCILRPFVGIDDDDAARDLVVNSLQHNAPHRRYADAAGHETAGIAALLWRVNGSIRSIQREFRAERHCFQYSLERRVTHPCGGHQIVLVRSARQEKPRVCRLPRQFQG